MVFKTINEPAAWIFVIKYTYLFFWLFLGISFFKEESHSILKQLCLTLFGMGFVFTFLILVLKTCYFLKLNNIAFFIHKIPKVIPWFSKIIIKQPLLSLAENEYSSLKGIVTSSNEIFLFINLIIILCYDFVEFSIPRFCSIGLIPYVLFLIFIGEWNLGILEAIISSSLCFFGFTSIYLLSKKKYGEPGLGEGDIELITLIGLLFGERVGLIIFFSGIIGLILYLYFYIAKKLSHVKEHNEIDLEFKCDIKIPFGSCLAITSLILLAHTKMQFFPIIQTMLNFCEAR